MRATNGVPSGVHCFLPVGTVNCVQTRKVNASPSLSADTPDDYKLKTGLMDDTFGIVEMGLLGTDKDYNQVGGYDLLWNDGRVDEHVRIISCYVLCRLLFPALSSISFVSLSFHFLTKRSSYDVTML
jgi:hypothetical protein